MDSDYDYDFLLSRIFQQHVSVENRKRIIIKPPIVKKIGPKRTLLENFQEIASKLHRRDDLLKNFLDSELGITSSVTGSNCLILSGKFSQTHIENVLKRFVKDFVLCQECHSAETLLQKDNRLTFLHCDACGSKRSIVQPKPGFKANVSRK